MYKNNVLLCLSFLLLGLSTNAQEAVFPDLEGQDLLEALQDSYTPASVLGYGEARDILFGEIDQQNNMLECVYTGWKVPLPPNEDPTQAAYQDGAGINTEHTWPQSLGASQEPARADMHHLYPTRVDVNGDRASFPFAEIQDNTTDEWFINDASQSNLPDASERDLYSELLAGTSFEPREQHKGNVARSMFYFYTIYRNTANSSFFNIQQSTLCDWHEQDPVDQLELDRTWLIAQHQDGKPNPFVLDCTLPSRIYCTGQVIEGCVSATEDPNDPAYIPIIINGAQPNPSRGLVKIPYELLTSGRLEVNWYDVNGRHYKRETKALAPGKYQLTTIPEFPGYWLCQFTFNDGERLYQQNVPVIVLP